MLKTGNVKKIKHKLFLLFFITLFYTSLSFESFSEEVPPTPWMTVNILPQETGISLLRYGTFGLGAYPYRYSLPAAGLRIYVDRIPLGRFSPFGSDLELIPSQLVDSFENNEWRKMNIVTKSITEDEPITSTSFFWV